MEHADKQAASFIAPKVDKDFILEVTDDGVPSLTRYQGVIVNVIPKPGQARKVPGVEECFTTLGTLNFSSLQTFTK